MNGDPKPEVESGIDFLEEVIRATPGDPRLEMCIQCGTCAGSCPAGPDMDHTPRAIFAMVRADMREEVYKSNTPWFCISCYYCTVRCPQEVHITDLMYTLKSMALRNGYARNTAWADFSQTFNEYVFNYGKAFELGLASRHSMRHASLRDFPGLAQLGLGMMTKQRMSLIPQKIDGLSGLQKILARADEIEEENR